MSDRTEADAREKNTDSAGKVKAEQTGLAASRSEEAKSASGDDYTVRKSRSYNILTSILALLFAFVLWLYAMSANSPNTEQVMSVPIEVTNIAQSGLSVLSGDMNTVEVTLLGKRSEISKLTAESIEAYVDAGDITKAGRYNLDVNVVTPSGVTVTSRTPTTISVYLDNTTSITLPVTVKYISYQLDDSYELGEAVSNPAEVTVTGPAALLDTLDTAQVSLTLGKMNNSVTVANELELINTDGEVVTSSYIRMNTTVASVTVPVYISREVPVSVRYKYGYFNENNVSVELDPATVLLRGEPEIINSLSTVELITIDEKKTISDTLVQQLTLPEGVVSVSGVETVRVKITHIGTSINEVTVPVAVSNPKGLDYTLQSDVINLRLRGPADLLDAISANDISATADLSYITNANGTTAVPVKIVFSENYSASVYEIGDYNVSVNVRG